MTAGAVELVLVGLLLTDLLLLGSSRVRGYINIVAIQGVLLGLLTLAFHAHALSLHILVLAGGSMVLKSLVFPALLRRAVREANVRAAIEPFVGYGVSLLAGTLALPLAFWLGDRLPLEGTDGGNLVLRVALYTIGVGLFLIVSRKKALTQVIGYLVLENGVFASAIVLVGEIPWIVELGVLLDVFVAVFVMGIAIYHINREFDHIDVDQLSALRG